MTLPHDPHRLDEVANFFRALAHPTRLLILEALRGEPSLSPTELVGRVAPGTGLANVAYHVRTLASHGLVAPAGRRPVRGALEHFYGLSRTGRELIELVDRAPGP